MSVPRLSRNTPNQFVTIGMVGGPVVVGVLGGTIRGFLDLSITFVCCYKLLRFVYRAIELGLFAWSVERYSSRITVYAEQVSATLQALPVDGMRTAGKMRRRIADFRTHAETMTDMSLRTAADARIRWWGYVEESVHHLKSSLIYGMIEPLHQAIDEIETEASQIRGPAAKAVVKSVRKARNQVIGLAYSKLGADVSRKGDRSVWLMAMIRNVAVITGVVACVGWSSVRVAGAV